MQVLSSLSGIPFYAPSAGHAPTNSADVSAIASAYQVVSSTATQLYAGTAYVTSVNGAPLSASRAGNAANASLASSAWYDGTGRLISALPDSATVSAIASAYAESAASGKQDTLTFGYDTSNNISSIDGSALAGGGGGGIDSATCSAIASAYAESAVSGKADSSALASYALSADVSGTVDLVSTQSANWGGSALALSAGPGVKFDKVGNTLVASTDETVLWENYTFANNRSDSVAMSEDPFNFSYVQITFEMETTTETWPTVQTQMIDMIALSSCSNKDFTLNGTCVNGAVVYARCSRCHFSGTAINDIASVQWYNGNVGTMTGPLHIYRIVGINRIASV